MQIKTRIGDVLITDLDFSNTLGMYVNLVMLKGEKGDPGTSGNYSQLTNKPSINGVQLIGNKTTTDLDLVSEATLNSEIDSLQSQIDDTNNDLDTLSSNVYTKSQVDTLLTSNFPINSITIASNGNVYTNSQLKYVKDRNHVFIMARLYFVPGISFTGTPSGGDGDIVLSPNANIPQAIKPSSLRVSPWFNIRNSGHSNDYKVKLTISASGGICMAYEKDGSLPSSGTSSTYSAEIQFDYFTDFGY